MLNTQVQPMIIIELIFNLSLLIAVSVLSGFILTYWKRNSIPGIVAHGLLFGTVALIGMLNAFELSPGIIFDGRSIVISLCTLFFGPVAGLIATLIALIYRTDLPGRWRIINGSFSYHFVLPDRSCFLLQKAENA